LAAKAWEEYSLEFPLSSDQLSCKSCERAHCLVETLKTPTADEYHILAEIFASEGPSSANSSASEGLPGTINR